MCHTYEFAYIWVYALKSNENLLTTQEDAEYFTNFYMYADNIKNFLNINLLTSGKQHRVAVHIY